MGAPALAANHTPLGKPQLSIVMNVVERPPQQRGLAGTHRDPDGVHPWRQPRPAVCGVPRAVYGVQHTRRGRPPADQPVRRCRLLVYRL